MSQTKKAVARRAFLASLLTGAGAVAALGAMPRKAGARKEKRPAGAGGVIQPILYRRTKDVERYYKTLYS